jgi:flagellar hook-associated protein 1 FlgK
MATSTFHGLETARRGMMTQQAALRTVGHNIANANTPGYTRQRVNFVQTQAYPGVGRNAPSIPGQVGTGVMAGSIQRIRDAFLDLQYRQHNTQNGYWDARADALIRMEEILNDLDSNGLANQIDQFWSKLQDLSADPEDTAVRYVLREQAVSLADSFNEQYMLLEQVRDDYGNEIGVVTDHLNSLLSQLNEINAQIHKVEPSGYVTNDLYDEQDRLLDQISAIIPIEVQRVKSGGNPNPVAEGAVTVTLKGTGITLVNGADKNALQQFEVAKTENSLGDEYVSGISISNGTDTVNLNVQELPQGGLKGLIEAFGYYQDPTDIDNSEVNGLYPNMLAELNVMVRTFVEALNSAHRIGYTLEDPLTGEVSLGGDFFVFDENKPAGTLKVSDDILNNANNIAAARVNLDGLTDDARQQYQTLLAAKDFAAIRTLLEDENSFKPGAKRAFAGDGQNALLLSEIKDIRLNFNGTASTFSNYYRGVMGRAAVETSEAVSKRDSYEVLRDNVQFERNSVSQVSLDEEMTLMIQFQHAYNAAARNITQIDEMLDRIINGMGIVGR